MGGLPVVPCPATAEVHNRRAAAQPAVVMQAWRANRHSGAQHGMRSRRSRQVQQALQAKQAKQAQRDRHSQKEAQSMWR